MTALTTLWRNADLARAYAAVRSDLPEATRAVWAEAFRAAVPAQPRRRLLDLGCGTGRFTALLGETFGAPVIGVDGSPAMLRERVIAPDAPVPVVAAEAGALPLREASIDLALLSMVYHLLAPPAPAVAVLHRVLAPGGWLLIRTPTLELLDRICWLPFFPGARAIDEARMPSRASIVATLVAAGFAPAAQRTVEQEFAPTPMAALEKVRRRPFSSLRELSDEAFDAGLARYESHCRTAPPTPLQEVLDLFSFHRV